jgi:hypothetical protein
MAWEFAKISLRDNNANDFYLNIDYLSERLHIDAPPRFSRTPGRLANVPQIAARHHFAA